MNGNLKTNYQKNSNNVGDVISSYMNGGSKTPQIEKLLNALLTLQATSTESERTFSIAGLFNRKIRCRLSDESIDALVFLKFYFK